jgi:hypothetical protein
MGSCTLVSGACTFVFSADDFTIPEGESGDITYTMTASYSGDLNYDPSTDSFSQVVDCETYTEDGDSSYGYQDQYQVYGDFWYVDWTETTPVTTYNCAGDDLKTTDSTNNGSYDCVRDGYDTSDEACDCDTGDYDAPIVYECPRDYSNESATYHNSSGYYDTGAACSHEDYCDTCGGCD